MNLINKKVIMLDQKYNEQIGVVIKEVSKDVYRIRLENGFRTVVGVDKFEVVEDVRKV